MCVQMNIKENVPEITCAVDDWYDHITLPLTVDTCHRMTNEMCTH